jgi:hypothetical protein
VTAEPAATCVVADDVSGPVAGWVPAQAAASAELATSGNRKRIDGMSDSRRLVTENAVTAADPQTGGAAVSLFRGAAGHHP